MGMCWAPDCKHYNVRDTCKFFRFPRSGKERSKWKRLLRRDIEPGPGAYVCSCHFRDGKKENGPELFLHNIAKRSLFDVTPAEKKKNPFKKRKQSSPSLSSSTTIIDRSSVTSEISVPKEPFVEASTSRECVLTSVSDLPATLQTNAALEAEVYFLKQENDGFISKTTYMSLRFSYENIQGNDKLIVLYTGLPNKQSFEALFNFIKDIPINYYLGWKVDKLTKIDQLLLLLMKLRLNCPHLELAQRFAISQTSVTNIILTYVHVLYELLYNQLMATIPSRQKNKSCLPTCFSNFTNCRIVLDCTEIFTVVARKSMKTQRLTYSNYKHHNTYKGLIGVAPNGVITYVSDLYVGSTSDQKIVQDCGILNALEAGDLVLADKGFLIQDLLPAGVSLNIPPFLTSPQFTPQQVKCTENIARARIHVERAIRRMKCYHILSFMPESLCAYGDIIFKTVAALTNFQYPLIKEVGQLFPDDEN